MSNGFRFKMLHNAWREPQRKRGGARARSPPYMKRIIGEILPVSVSFITQRTLQAIKILSLRALF